MLLARERAGVVEAAGRLGGLQAQEPRPPFLGLWSRLEGFAPDDLRAALDARSVVRAMAMRATLHLMDAAGFRAVRAALEPAMESAMNGALKGRMDGLDLGRVLPAARALLEDGPLTFARIREGLAAEFPGVDERALGYAVRTRLPLVMVPTGDRWCFPAAAAFTLAEEWLGEPIGDADGAGGAPALALRHLAAFGPSTPADAQAWCGVPGVRAAMETLRPRLTILRDEAGRELLDLPEAPRPGEDADAPARLLPEFDSLLLAYADRTRIVPAPHQGRITTRNLRVRAVLLWDGFAAGAWSLATAKGVATLTLEPFARLPKGATAALREEAEAMARVAAPGARAHEVRVARH